MKNDHTVRLFVQTLSIDIIKVASHKRSIEGAAEGPVASGEIPCGQIVSSSTKRAILCKGYSRFEVFTLDLLSKYFCQGDLFNDATIHTLHYWTITPLFHNIQNADAFQNILFSALMNKLITCCPNGSSDKM